MNNDKNDHHSETQQDNPQNDQEYRFINETIKNRPINKKVLFRRIAVIVAGAVLFGAIAGLVFAFVNTSVFSRLNEEEASEEVDINVEEPEESGVAEATEGSEDAQATEESEEAQVTEGPEEVQATEGSEEAQATEGSEDAEGTEESVTAEDAEGTEVAEATQEGAEETAEPTLEVVPEILEVPRSITLEDYEQIYEEIMQVAEEPLKSMVSVTGMEEQEDLLNHSYLTYGQSSGVIIAKESKTLYILTQISALGEDPGSVLVTFCDGAVAEGSLRRSDDRTGFAVVTVSTKDLLDDTKEVIEVASLGNSYSLRQGAPVIAIGSPTGYSDSVVYGNLISVSTKVSVVDAEYTLLVTDIQGNLDGNGVLLDTDGNVIGIIAQAFGNQTDNLIKALSVSQLDYMLTILSNGEEINYLGIIGQDVTESISLTQGIPVGVYVDDIETDSPAMIAGIQSADVITEFNGSKVSTMQTLSSLLQNCEAGQNVSIKLMRRGTDEYVEMEFVVTIAAR